MTLAVPLRTDAPRNTTFVLRASGASAATIPGCFSTGNDSPVMLASLTRKSPASRDPSVGGNQVPRREHQDVARHERVGVHCAFDAVAHDAAGEGESLLQLLDRRGGAGYSW